MFYYLCCYFTTYVKWCAILWVCYIKNIPLQRSNELADDFLVVCRKTFDAPVERHVLADCTLDGKTISFDIDPFALATIRIK